MTRCICGGTDLHHPDCPAHQLTRLAQRRTTALESIAGSLEELVPLVKTRCVVREISTDTSPRIEIDPLLGTRILADYQESFSKS